MSILAAAVAFLGWFLLAGFLAVVVGAAASFNPDDLLVRRAQEQDDAWTADEAELAALDEHLNKYEVAMRRDRLAWERSMRRAIYGGGWR